LYDIQKESIAVRKKESEIMETIIDIEKEKLGMILAKNNDDDDSISTIEEQVIIDDDEE
jgi:hypothetical protein